MKINEKKNKSNSKKIDQDLIIDIYTYPSWTLNDRQTCDIELLLNGGFSPLRGFLNRLDYESVIKSMRLANGSLWPIPITLDVSRGFSNSLENQQKVLLRDKEGFPIAILHIEDIWEPDLQKEAKLVYKTKDKSHPAVQYLLYNTNKVYIGGNIEKISMPRHYDYINFRHSPKALKAIFRKNGWENVIAFQTRNPIHKAHVELTFRALKENNAKLLIHPSVGLTKPGDVDYFTRVRCYKHILKYYENNIAMLSLLPLAMRMGGPKEALWHAIIRKNYGCSHMIVGRDHAGPGLNDDGKPFYGPFEAQNLLIKYENEIGIKMVPFKFMVYVPNKKKYQELDKLKEDEKYKTISGTELRNLLNKGSKIPEWFSFPEVVKELKKTVKPLHNRGFTVFFTGLSGSGKSTLANGLLTKFLELGDRSVTLLDGDIVRTHLSSELGFSKEHRSINVQRIGFVASEITKNGGIAICAPIAPYEKDRKFNKDLISKVGGYIEVFVNTSIQKCEERDVKGLYALAREGKIKEFTGISDPYEPPLNPDISINSSDINPAILVEKIFQKVKKIGFIK